MTIQSKLEEAIGNLVAAREEALIPTGSKLWNAIGVLLVDCHKALNLALADPGKTWLEETDVSWTAFGIGTFATSRFAAGVAAGELRKYAKQSNFVPASNTNLYQQIADLEAIAKGGGE